MRIKVEYPSNRHSQPKDDKNTDKKIEAVVSGEVVRRKKPLRKRFSETFVGGDARSVASYVFLDVLIPAAKDMVADAMSMGVEKMLYGDVRSSSRRPRGANTNTGYVSYNRFGSSNTRPEPRVPNPSRRSRANHDFDEIILATRVEAEEVVDRLFDLVSRYEVATVSDLYELVGVAPNYTDDKYGWTDIRGAGVQRVRNGYLLDLPKPEPLD